jgi:broad specificity phosphatase PhoE
VLYLVRHGQTTWNAQGRLVGHADPPLTDLGRSQAAAAARALVPVLAPDARVVCSPLGRAVATAEAFGRPVEVEEAWIELDYGDFDGKAFADVPDEVWQVWRTDPTYAPPGGESLVAVSERVERACKALEAEAATSDVVVVSHVSPIKAAVAWAVGAPPTSAFHMHLDVATVCRIAMSDQGPVLRTFNESIGADYITR